MKQSYEDIKKITMPHTVPMSPEDAEEKAYKGSDGSEFIGDLAGGDSVTFAREVDGKTEVTVVLDGEIVKHEVIDTLDRRSLMRSYPDLEFIDGTNGRSPAVAIEDEDTALFDEGLSSSEVFKWIIEDEHEVEGDPT